MNNVRLSTLTPGEAKARDRWLRHRRGEWTKWEIAEEIIGIVGTAILVPVLFVILIHL